MQFAGLLYIVLWFRWMLKSIQSQWIKKRYVLLHLIKLSFAMQNKYKISLRLHSMVNCLRSILIICQQNVLLLNAKWCNFFLVIERVFFTLIGFESGYVLMIKIERINGNGKWLHYLSKVFFSYLFSSLNWKSLARAFHFESPFTFYPATLTWRGLNWSKSNFHYVKSSIHY